MSDALLYITVILLDQLYTPLCLAKPRPTDHDEPIKTIFACDTARALLCQAVCILQAS